VIAGEERNDMTSNLSQLEASVGELPRGEQLLLVERLMRRLRMDELSSDAAWRNSLAEMAGDAQIQRELRAIANDFMVTEADGLKSL